MLDNEDDDDIDAWNDPSSTVGAGGEAMLSKYDDVEDLAIKKKRANRMEIGGSILTESKKSKNETKSKADSGFITKKVIGSDYYATNEEDPLLSAAGGFKKKKLAGNKRNRIGNGFALVDNEEEDIVSALEGSSKTFD